MLPDFGMSDESNFSSSQEDRVSLADSLPMEMVETILQHLSVPDLLVTAAHLPKWWQTVCQNSPEIWRKLARYDYDEDINILLTHTSPARRKKLQSSSERTGLCLLRQGVLFINRSPRGRGYIFAPARHHSSLKIIDPETKNPSHGRTSRGGSWSLKLYDLDGVRVCSEQLNNGTLLYLSRFFRKVVKDREARTE